MKAARKDKLISILGVLVGLTLMQACSPKLEPEQPCGFVQNSYSQRVSWEGNTPMTLYIDDSVPSEYYVAIESAANNWNSAAGKTLILVSREDVGSDEPSKDGVSKIYLMDTWDVDMPTEQARTTVHWRGNVLNEADIRLNGQNFRFYTSYSSNNDWTAIHLESLVLHELGHGLGLAHSGSSKSVMQTSLAQSTIRDTIGQEDLSSLACEYTN